MSITIYRDNSANAIFIEDANGAQFINSLQAVIGLISGTCSVNDTAKSMQIVTSVDYSDYLDQNGDPYGADEVEVCNNLNAIFQSSGSVGSDPLITSSLTVSISFGDTLNYTLTADYGVGYEWDFSGVAGIVNVEGNSRKIIGGSVLAVGVYNIPVKAINYYGEDSQTIVLTVSSPPYNNTKSVFFRQNDYCQISANASNPLYRSSQNSANAWTISFWMKASSSNNQNQTVISFGGIDNNNDGRIDIKYNGNNSQRRRVNLFYGTNNNNISMYSSVGSAVGGNWSHWVFVYDGGTTENGSGGINSSYSRFKIYRDGVQEATVNSNSNYGFSGEIKGEHFRLGRRAGGTAYSRNGNVDELALWSSDESLNVSQIYNSGLTHDLNLLTSSPQHYWRMGDGDTYPILTDVVGSLDATMINMTVADIVSDVP